MPTKNAAVETARTKTASALIHLKDAPPHQAGLESADPTAQDLRLAKLRKKHSKRSKEPEATKALASPLTLPLDGLSKWATIKPFVPFSAEWVRQAELANRFPRRIKCGSAALYSNRAIHDWLADPAGWKPAETVEG
jgi:hypothetical protein